MEINETWNQLCDAWATEEWPRMNALATELIRHLNAGGEPPRTLQRAKMRAIDEVIARSVCALVLDFDKTSGSEANKYDILKYLREYCYFDADQ